MRHRLFTESQTFTRFVGDYLDDEQYSALQLYMLEHPKSGPVIRGSGGVRKLRWKMAKRDIGQEILDSINEIKAGDVGRVHVYITAEQIKAVREKVGVSQSAFAAMLNVSTRTLQEWEQGRRQPNGPARSLLAVAAKRPDVMQDVFAA